jgi:hypothetical protein
MVGNQKLGAQTHSFNLLAVASYTKRISPSPFGTAKNLMNDLIVKPVEIRYRRLSTFPIFSLVFSLKLESVMAGCVPLVVGPSFVNHAGTPSLAILRYRGGKRKWTNLEPALNSNQLVWVECQSKFAIADWSLPGSVNTPSRYCRGFPIQSGP